MSYILAYYNVMNGASEKPQRYEISKRTTNPRVQGAGRQDRVLNVIVDGREGLSLYFFMLWTDYHFLKEAFYYSKGKTVVNMTQRETRNPMKYYLNH